MPGSDSTVRYTPGEWANHAPPGTSPCPPDIDMCWPGTPGAVRLKAGEQIRGSLRFSLPVLEFDMFATPDPEAPHARVTVRRARFCIEYVPRTWFMRREKYRGYPGIYPVGGPYQQVIAEAPITPPCELLRRTDDVHRFTLKSG